MENTGIIIGLIAVTMIVGFIGIIIMLIQTSSQIRAEITSTRVELNTRIDRVETRIDRLEDKIDKLADKLDSIITNFLKNDRAA